MEQNQDNNSMFPVGELTYVLAHIRGHFGWRDIIQFRVEGSGSIKPDDVFRVPQDERGIIFARGSWGYYPIDESKIERL